MSLPSPIVFLHFRSFVSLLPSLLLYSIAFLSSLPFSRLHNPSFFPFHSSLTTFLSPSEVFLQSFSTFFPCFLLPLYAPAFKPPNLPIPTLVSPSLSHKSSLYPFRLLFNSPFIIFHPLHSPIHLSPLYYCHASSPPSSSCGSSGPGSGGGLQVCDTS